MLPTATVGERAGIVFALPNVETLPEDFWRTFQWANETYFTGMASDPNPPCHQPIPAGDQLQ